MTDDRPGMAVEDRLARALEHRAATTGVSPDAWERIEERTAQARRRRAATGWVGVPALAVVVAALVAVVTGGAGDDRQVTASEPGPAYFTVQGVEGRFALNAVLDAPARPDAASDGSTRVYGRRAADGLAFDATIIVTTYPEVSPTTGPPDLSGEQIDVGGRTAVVRTDGGDTSIRWQEQGVIVEVTGIEVSRAEVVAVAERTQVDRLGARATTLPAGFDQVVAGPWPGGPQETAERVTHQVWSQQGLPPGGPPVGFDLTVYEGPGLSLDSIAWTMRRARRSEVGGRPALLDPAAGAMAWVPSRGVLLVLSTGYRFTESPGSPSPGDLPLIDEAQLQDLVGRVRAIDEATWRRLVAGLPSRTSTTPVEAGAASTEDPVPALPSSTP